MTEDALIYIYFFSKLTLSLCCAKDRLASIVKQPKWAWQTVPDLWIHFNQHIKSFKSRKKKKNPSIKATTSAVCRLEWSREAPPLFPADSPTVLCDRDFARSPRFCVRERKPGAAPILAMLAPSDRLHSHREMAFLFVEGLSWQAPLLAEEQAFFSSVSLQHFHTDDRHTAALNTHDCWKRNASFFVTWATEFDSYWYYLMDYEERAQTPVCPFSHFRNTDNAVTAFTGYKMLLKGCKKKDNT